MTSTELERFFQFLSAKLAEGGGGLALEAVVDEWRTHEEVAAIREGLRAVEEDRFPSSSEFIRSFQIRHGLRGRRDE